MNPKTPTKTNETHQKIMRGSWNEVKSCGTNTNEQNHVPGVSLFQECPSPSGSPKNRTPQWIDPISNVWNGNGISTYINATNW